MAGSAVAEVPMMLEMLLPVTPQPAQPLPSIAAVVGCGTVGLVNVQSSMRPLSVPGWIAMA